MLLVDSDAFVLFAAAGLLDRVIACLGFHASDVRRLAALSAILRRGKKFADLTETERAMALLECDRIAPLRESPTADTLQQIAGIGNIDGGEAALFAMCHDNGSAVLLTGDKKALRGLAGGAPSFCARLHGRVVCVEQVLARIVGTDGLATVAAALVERCKHHKTLVVCFSEVNRADQRECLQALRAYEDDLAKDLPAGWLRQLE